MSWSIIILIVLGGLAELVILAYAWAGWRYSREYIKAINELQGHSRKFQELTADLETTMEDYRKMQ